MRKRPAHQGRKQSLKCIGYSITQNKLVCVNSFCQQTASFFEFLCISWVLSVWDLKVVEQGQAVTPIIAEVNLELQLHLKLQVL